MDNTAPDRQWVTCPGCTEAFDPDSESPAKGADGSLQCPFCSTRFMPGPSTGAPEAIPSPVTPGHAAPPEPDPEPVGFAIEDDTEPDDAPVVPRPARRTAQDLNTLKVRELSAGRRALFRLRSWSLVATCGFAVAAVQLIILTVAHVRHEGWWLKPIGYALFVPVTLLGAFHFLRKVRALSRELRKPALDDPATPPDFSPLSDGSQVWKKLEEL